MAYKQKPGRGNSPKTGKNIPLDMKSPLSQIASAGDLNRAAYEAEKFLKNIKNDPFGQNKSADLELPVFRYRGKEAFNQSLKDSDYIQPSFTKEGSDPKYRYLSSRFEINPEIKDFRARSGYDRGRLSSRSDDNKKLQDAIAKRAYTGVDQTLKEAEEGARVSANIYENLQKARETGNEANLKNAIENARATMREDKFLRSTKPVITHPDTGETIINDQAAYANARMIQDFINQSREATKRQNAADRFRWEREDFARWMANRKPFSISKFDERSGN